MKNSGKASESAYGELGVSATKAGLHSALGASGLPSHNEFFIELKKDISANPQYSSFLHSDGAGTKGIVAYLVARETGEREVYSHLADDALVMNTDDVLTVGIPEALLVGNTIQRNARLIEDEVLTVVIRRYLNLCEMLTNLGIPTTFAGGETADCGDVVRTVLIDAVISGRIANDSLISTKNIVPGDVIVGLSSTGQASYELAPNSGIGANGLTLARHSLLSSELAKRYPEIVDPSLSERGVSYRGPFGVTDKPKALGMTVGTALSSPTRMYAPVLVNIYRELRGRIHGAIHCTGGGQTKVLRFGEGNRYVKDNLFDVPPLFALIQQHGEIKWREMYQVFNMGHRFELYLKEEDASAVIEIAKSFSVAARVVGRVEPSSAKHNQVVLKTKFGVFEYTL